MAHKAPALTSIDIRKDRNLLGRFFGDDSWSTWDTLCKARSGLKLTAKELDLYRKLTKRNTTPTELRELWMVIGRRGRKSRNAAFWAFESAFFTDWKKILPPGERGYILMIYPDRRQGRITMDYLRAFIDSSPMFRANVERELAESIRLTNGITLEVATCSFRNLRGYTIETAICDEISFWRSEESTNPDREVIAALRPAMVTVPNSLLICISSPYSRRGELWNAYRKNFSKEHQEILVVQAPTQMMNPLVPESVIESAMEEDEPSARAEYLGEFRRDIEAFISREVVEAVTIPGRRELAAVKGIRYWAFTDPSGGSQDSMTLAIAHRENETVILDVIRERKPPFSPEEVVREFAQILKLYQVGFVVGDRYGGEWPREQFRKCGIAYKPSDLFKSDIYLSLLPLINSEKAELLDDSKLKNQLLNLERRTSRSGKDSIDHGPGGHDDVANAAAGVLVMAGRLRERKLTWGRDRDPGHRIRPFRPFPMPKVLG